MFMYWFVLLTISVIALRHEHPSKLFRVNHNLTPSWRIVFLLLTVFIGLRYEVGGDWFNYEKDFGLFVNELNNSENASTDFAYIVLNRISGLLGFNIYGVNVACAAIFLYGLIRFCLNQPYPWLAMVIAFPYLIVVVSMGYTRQSVAIGLVMLAITFLLEKRIYVYWVVIISAALFHKTALIFIGLPFILGYLRFKYISLIGILISLLLAFGAFLFEDASNFVQYYVTERMESGGGFYRLLMNVPPMIILILLKSRWMSFYQDWRLWCVFSFFSILLIFAFEYGPAAADRLGLYLIPLQIAVYSRLPQIVNIGKPAILIFMGILYSALIMFVWLFHAINSFLWLPYQSLIGIFFSNSF